MKKLLVILGCLALPCLAFAYGGGGFEYFTNVGPDLLPSLNSTSLVTLPSGSVLGASAFGYGVTAGGWKIGGFGMFFYTDGLSIPIPYLGRVDNASGWVAGVLSGGQARLGPFRLSLNFRMGAGMAFADWFPTAALYGSVDGEVGILFVPAMLLSAYTGIGVIAPFLYNGPVPMGAIIAGIRITWGYL